MDTFILAIMASVALVGLTYAAYLIGRRKVPKTLAELNRLNEIGQRLLRAELDVDALCEFVYQQAGQVIDTSLFQLGLFEDNAYHVKVWTRDGERLPQQIFLEGGKQGIVGWVHQAGRSVLVRDFEAERETLPAFPQFDLASPPRSGLFVPLIAGESTIGVIAVQSREPETFSSEDLHILTAIAYQAASAIRNAQLYQRARYHAEQLRLLGEIIRQVQTIQPLPNLFRQIVTLTRETFGYYCVSVLIHDGEVLHPGASTSPTMGQCSLEIPLGRGMIGWAAAQGETALANDVALDSRYEHLAALPETRSEIALPLKAEGRVLGVLDVQSTEVGAFGSEDVSLLEALAAQAAIAIEQAQIYEAERQLAQRLEALIQASRAVVSMLELDKLLDEVVDLIEDVFNFERAHIFLRAADRLNFHAGSGAHSERWLIEGLCYSLDDSGIIPWVGRTGEVMRVADVVESPFYRPGLGIEDTRSELAVPIVMVDRVLGVIDLQSRTPGAFGPDDERLMQALADTVAIAIRNAALYANERRRRMLADSLREIGATLTSNLDLDSVLAGILSGLERVVDLEAAAILLPDDTGETLQVAATIGPLTRQATLGQTLPVSEATESYHVLLGLPKDHACLEVSLSTGEGLSGHLIVEDSRREHYEPDELEIVMAFAGQAAVAIENARLYAAQQAEAWITAALLQVAEAINEGEMPDETLQTITRLTPLLVGVQRCAILRWSEQDEWYVIEATYGLDAEHIQALQASPPTPQEALFWGLLSVSDRLIGAGEGHTLPIPDKLKQPFQTSSALGVPLIAQGKQVGAMIVDDPWDGRPPDPRLYNILVGIANQTALVLKNAALQAQASEQERLERELEVARDIQASLMPDCCPLVPGWELAATWRAARQVGGDFYDFIRLSDTRWGLVVADVADKGVPAALFMALSRTLLRAVAISRRAAASTLLRVNELLRNDSRSDLFVTMFFAVWDTKTGELVYANAGHNPPLLVNARSGKIKQLKGKGIALGILSDIVIEEHQLHMDPGDVLLAYTDGLTEAMQTDYTEWGQSALEDTLSRLHGHSAEDILAGILEAVDDFVGGAPQSDDLTLWVLKRGVTSG